VTVGEHIERNSFAYDADFPPDVAEGEPLRSVCRKRPVRPSAVRRALHGCARLVAAHGRRG
jgi:hypothetical protein